MSKITTLTLSLFQTNLLEFVQARATASQMLAALKRHATKMTQPERVECDGMIVLALETKYGIESRASSRPVLSGWTFAPTKEQKDSLAPDQLGVFYAANVALSDARGILVQRETAAKGSSRAKKAGNAAQAGQGSPMTVKAATDFLAAALKAGDADAKAAVKALMLAIL